MLDLLINYLSFSLSNILLLFHFRNPSIDGDTPFKPITSSHEFYTQDITNDAKTSVITDMLEATRYNVWQEIERIYKKLKVIPDDNYEYCNALTCN